MFDILFNLKIDVSHLKNNNLGKYINDIAKNFKFNPKIMKRAAELVEKWSRLIYNINNDYCQYSEEIYENNNYLKKRRSIVVI